MSGAETTTAFGGFQTPRAESRAVLIPVAYDLTTSYACGSRNGPRALIEASTHMELFDEELGFPPTDVGVHTLGVVEQIASGPDAMIRRVADLVRGVLREDRLPILIGGEHSISIGAFSALAELHPDTTIVQLDAHADLREEFQDSPYSHACVMARARERFDCVQIGIRSLSATEYDRVRRERLAVFPARRCKTEAEEVIRDVSALLGRRIYVTIDLDVFDPSVLPATGTPEPGGLLWEEVSRFVQALTRDREVVGFDVVELSPIPGLHAPEFTAAKLVNRVLGCACPLPGST